MLRLQQRKPADRDTDDDPGPIRRQVGEAVAEPRLFHGLRRGANGELQEAGGAARPLLVQVLKGIETLHLTGEADGLTGGVEERDRTRSAHAPEERVPRRVHIETDGRDHPDARDGDTPRWIGLDQANAPPWIDFVPPLNPRWGEIIR